ncbi:MAG: hypothetical protein ABDI07_05600 [Candidatus Kryptonium sp.]
MLSKLETQGKSKWLDRWRKHIAFPDNLNPEVFDRKESEKVLRYLVLRVLINQQAKIEKVRELSTRIVVDFEDKIFFRPHEISEIKLFETFKNIAGHKGSELYRVGAIGGIKPISLFAYRFKAYEGFIRWLNETNQNLLDIVITKLKNNKPIKLFEFFNKHQALSAGWVGNDPKACRMLVNWIVFLLNEIWHVTEIKISETLMIVDGHVGKIFCRTGLIDTVIYESKRPYIIQANKLRPLIEKLVLKFEKIPFYVDNGAFYIFEDGYCTDLNPKCEICPLTELCLKHTKWTSYQINRNINHARNTS